MPDKAGSIAEPVEVCPFCGANQAEEKRKGRRGGFLIALLVIGLLVLARWLWWT